MTEGEEEEESMDGVAAVVVCVGVACELVRASCTDETRRKVRADVVLQKILSSYLVTEFT